MEIVRLHLGLRDRKWKYSFSFYRDHVVLILQNAFDHEERFGGEQDAVLVQKFRMHDRIGNSGFILETQEKKTFGCAGALANDNGTDYFDRFAIALMFQCTGWRHA